MSGISQICMVQQRVNFEFLEWKNLFDEGMDRYTGNRAIDIT